MSSPSNAAAFEGEYQFLGFLPFEETKYNKTLAGFIKYVGKSNADQFSAYAFEATLAFADAIKAAVAKSGINGITRTSTIDGIKSLTDFNAGGMAGTHSFKTARTTNCFVEGTVQEREMGAGVPDQEGHLRLQGVERRRDQGEPARELRTHRRPTTSEKRFPIGSITAGQLKRPGAPYGVLSSPCRARPDRRGVRTAQCRTRTPWRSSLMTSRGSIRGRYEVWRCGARRRRSPMLIRRRVE